MKVTEFFLNITSEDPERLVAFYREVVALEPKPEYGPHSFHIGPGSTLGIDGHSETRGSAKEPSRILVDLWVEDVAAEEARLEGRGVSFTRKQGVEYWGGVISTFADPDGNCVQIIQVKPELARMEEAAATA